MQIGIFILGFLFSFSSFAALESPFPSRLTDQGITIPNAGPVLRGKGRVYRGSLPVNSDRDNTNQLLQAEIDKVLIFKDSTSGDVEREIEILKSLGYSKDSVLHIPFPWRNIEDFQKTCLQTLDALEFVLNAYQTAGETVYFHCTVGEDRTGYLSGLLKQLVGEMSAETSFKEELCENGYAAGNPQKPQFVVNAIRKSLTPLYFQMSELIRSGKIRMNHLDRSACSSLPKPVSPVPKCQRSSRISG